MFGYERAFRRIAGTLIVALSLIACSGASSSASEVVHVLSPSGSVVAVVEEVNEGAAASYGYRVYLRESELESSSTGILVAVLYGAIRNDEAYGVNLHWVSDKNLQISFLQVKSASVATAPVSIGGRQILVSLRDGVSDPSAPAGAMARH